MNQQTEIAGKPAVNINKISWLYFIALTCQMIGNSVINSFVSFYATERLLLSAAMMAGILTASRVCDLVIGTLSGLVVQKVCPRFGQYRSWLLYGPLMVSIGSTLCFINLDVPMGVKLFMVFIGYIGYGTGMSFVQLGQNGLIPKIAGADGRARQKIASRITQGQNVARLLSSAMLVPMVLFFDSLGKVDGYTMVQIIFSVIALVGQAFLFVALREVDKYDPHFKAEGMGGSVKITKILSAAVTNSQLLILLLSDVIRFTAMQVISALGAYYFTYATDNYSMLTVSMTVQGFASAAAAFLCPPFSRKIGKKNSAILAGLGCMLPMIYLGFFSGGSWLVYIICNSIAQFTFVILACNGPTLYIDAGEYQLYKTGVDNRTFVTSIFGIASKFSWIFVGGLTAVVLIGCGYDEVNKTVADVDMMIKLVGGLPAAMFLVFTLLMAFGYRLSEDRVKVAYEANIKTMQARADAAAKNDKG